MIDEVTEETNITRNQCSLETSSLQSQFKKTSWISEKRHYNIVLPSGTSEIKNVLPLNWAVMVASCAHGNVELSHAVWLTVEPVVRECSVVAVAESLTSIVVSTVTVDRPSTIVCQWVTVVSTECCWRFHRYLLNNVFCNDVIIALSNSWLMFLA